MACSKYPFKIPYVHISQKYFGLKIFGIFWIFWDFWNPKYQIFLDQNIFVRYGHMLLGVLKAYQKVMENEIFRSINPFKTWFFQTKKIRKFRVQKWPKYVILSCGIKKRSGGEKDTEYMTWISIVSRFGGQLLIKRALLF